MTGRYEQRLRELGIVLPEPAAPVANYIPVSRAGSLLYVSGQLPTEGGRDRYAGKLGEISIEDGQKAARICAINIIGQLKAALGDLDRVVSCVRLGGFVNALPDFADHPKVLNGASDLMVEVFGEAGRHARAAVGCASLPRNVAVEVDAIFEVADQ